MLCPRENMEDQCGKKIHKFDAKDKTKELKFSAPWYKPGDVANNPGLFPLFKFDKLGVCNYVFIMPDNVEIDSSFTLKFEGSNRDKNRNTQAYYASYASGPEDKELKIGDIMTKYDGEWDYMIPDDASADVKANPEGKGYL